MSTTSNTIFTGTSRFTNDFQQVITRSVAIASLPITQLTNQKAALTDQATEIGTLSAKFTSLQTAFQNLDSSTGLSSLTTSLSDAGIAQVTLANGAAPASYSLEVTSLGSFTNTLSLGSSVAVSDPAKQSISASSTFRLTINGITTQVTPAANTLNSLVSALNTTPGVNVEASLVNVGSTQSPDYRLSIQSTKLGGTAIQLNDGSADLLSTLSTGSFASYKINGLSTSIQSDSRTVTLAPGVSATLLGQSATGVAARIGITRQANAIGNALSALVTSYNAVADELEKNRGKNGGPLAGNSIISELGNKLRELGSYSSGSGQLSSLASLGVTFDGKGHLSYDPSVFSNAGNSNLVPLTGFLGSAATGGLLKTATDLLSSINNVTSGSLAQSANLYQTRISNQETLIESNQARVDQLKVNLQAQLAKADARVAALEQSYNVLSGLFLAQQINNQNK